MYYYTYIPYLFFYFIYLKIYLIIVITLLHLNEFAPMAMCKSNIMVTKI